MAATFSLHAQAVAWAAGKNMLAISNHTGSGVVLRIYRLYLINVSTGAVTGAMCTLDVMRFTSVSSFTGGSAISFIKLDTNSTTPPATVLANAGTTTSLTKSAEVFRRVLWSNDEVASAGTGVEDITTMIPLCKIFDTGLNSNVEPIVLREGEGLVLFTPASGGGTYAGSVDIAAELTIT